MSCLDNCYCVYHDLLLHTVRGNPRYINNSRLSTARYNLCEDVVDSLCETKQIHMLPSGKESVWALRVYMIRFLYVNDNDSYQRSIIYLGVILGSQFLVPSIVSLFICPYVGQVHATFYEHTCSWLNIVEIHLTLCSTTINQFVYLNILFCSRRWRLLFTKQEKVMLGLNACARYSFGCSSWSRRWC